MIRMFGLESNKAVSAHALASVFISVSAFTPIPALVPVTAPDNPVSVPAPSFTSTSGPTGSASASAPTPGSLPVSIPVSASAFAPAFAPVPAPVPAPTPAVPIFYQVPTFAHDSDSISSVDPDCVNAPASPVDNNYQASNQIHNNGVLTTNFFDTMKELLGEHIASATSCIRRSCQGPNYNLPDFFSSLSLVASIRPKTFT